LPACRQDRRLEASDSPPGAVLRFPADTTAFFLRDERAILSSLRRQEKAVA